MRQCDCWRGALASMRVVEEGREKVAQVDDTIAMALSLSLSLFVSLPFKTALQCKYATEREREREILLCSRALDDHSFIPFGWIELTWNMDRPSLPSNWMVWMSGAHFVEDLPDSTDFFRQCPDPPRF